MIDFNAKLGHWPYRPVRGVEPLLREMDGLGIEKAVVSSLSAVHYFDPQQGNEELLRIAAPHRDRLVPFAVLKPQFTGAIEDLRRCVEEEGMRGLVLHPNYHRFALDAPQLASMMAYMAEQGLPVGVQTAMEDMRRQFDRLIVPDVALEALAEFIREYPRVSIVALGLKVGQPEQLGTPLPRNAFFDTSSYEKLGELEAAAQRLGPDRILFGTNFPLLSPQANSAKIEAAELAPGAAEAIRRGNAAALLGL